MLTDLPPHARSVVLSSLSIRQGVGAIGLLLPLLLGPMGWLVWGIEIQDNMSQYYHTALRDGFVGAMCAVGIFLFCYRGYDWIENWTANFGCLSALGVALFPLDANRDPLDQRSLAGYLHLVSGAAFFLTLAFYSLYHFPSHQPEKRERAPHEAQRDFIYRTSGLAILFSLAAMGTHLFLVPTEWKHRLNDYHFLFWMEWLATWAFAAAWLTKGRAIVAEIAVEILAWPEELLHQRRP
jgi:hypothetical protein